MYTKLSPGSRTQGFTIVELLIVVVVIAILAAITIVSYNGIQKAAKETAVKSELRSASDQARSTQILDGSFPEDSSGFKSSGGTSYQYSVNNGASPPTFCLTATNGSIAYYTDQAGSLIPGACPGHINGVGASGIAWAPLSTPNAYWSVVYASSDASKLILYGTVTASSTGVAYRSSDSGQTWAAAASLPSGQNMQLPGAFSTDGSRLVLSGFANGTSTNYRSTNLGVSWASIPTSAVVSYALSSDATRWYYAQTYDNDNGGGSIFRSVDGGTTWTEVLAAGQAWNAIETSADGMRVFAYPSGTSYIKFSSNGGTNWSDLTAGGSRVWTSLATSADGQKIAAISNGTLYISSNGGTNWTAQSGLTSRARVAMSADGSKIITTPITNGADTYVYVSTNGGSSWNQETPLGAANWSSPVVARNGSKYYVIKYVSGSQTQIYVGK